MYETASKKRNWGVGKGFGLTFNCKMYWSWRTVILPPPRAIRLGKLGTLAWHAPCSGGGGGGPQSVLVNRCWAHSAVAVWVEHQLLYSWSKEVEKITLPSLHHDYFQLLNIWTPNNGMEEKWSGTVPNQRNRDKWFKWSQLENAWWTERLNRVLKTLQVRLVELWLPEGNTLLRILPVPKPFMNSIIFIFVIRKDFSNIPASVVCQKWELRKCSQRPSLGEKGKKGEN